jgi:HEAT repeat protein
VRYRGRKRYRSTKMRYLPIGLSIQEILDWIESLAEGEHSHQQNILKFNDAINDLITYGEPAVEPIIDHLLHTNNRWMQWGAIWALRDIGDQRAIEPIWIVFNRAEHDLGIQHDALIALGRLKDARIFETALSLLDHGNIHLRQSAILALGVLGDIRAVEILIPLLEYPNEDLRSSVIRALGNLKDDRAFEPLIDRIPKAKLPEKSAIVDALVKIGGTQAIDSLQKIIDSEDIKSLESSQFDRLRCYAVNTLAQMNDPAIVPILEAALNHPKRGVRRHARKALEKYQHHNTDENSTG